MMSGTQSELNSIQVNVILVYLCSFIFMVIVGCVLMYVNVQIDDIYTIEEINKMFKI